MPLTLVAPRAKSKNYYIRGTVRGIDIYQTTGTSITAKAEEIRIKKEHELLEESIHGPRVSRKFSKAAVEYVERRQPDRTQEHAIIGYVRKDGSVGPCLIADFGDVLCSKINQEMVDRVVKKRFAGRSQATILRNFLTPLVAVLTYASKRQWCDAPRLERPKGKEIRAASRPYLKYEEADRLLAAANPHLYRLILFLLLSGARLGEALALEWQDVDLSDRWMVLRNTKRNGEDRGVPLHPQLVVMLANLPRPKSGEDRVLLSSLGRPYYDTSQGGNPAKTAWKATLARAGVDPNLHMHDLRHTFSTWLLLLGVVDEVREMIMGHRSTKISRTYAHAPDRKLIDTVALLPERGKYVDKAFPYPGKANENREVA